MIREWFEIKELLGVGGLATTVQGITKKAKKENWRRRRVAGVKGNVFEYYVGDMPPRVQQALGVAGALSLDESVAIGGEQAPNAVKQALVVIEQVLNKACAPAGEELNHIERHLVRCFRRAGEEGRVAILTLAESMAGLQEKKEAAQLFEADLNVV